MDVGIGRLRHYAQCDRLVRELQRIGHELEFHEKVALSRSGCKARRCAFCDNAGLNDVAPRMSDLGSFSGLLAHNATPASTAGRAG
ncbi:hypothetical protein PAMC26510_34735 [Caballeronia sordidicola]|uniref:Uncharacterized protein n=1 Tax=Caballeronia sordidicola TaxID=196367 RepID=A0A242M5M4_CABSO|nr:hypothetical protein PAMC26510_34735 [Caballeronia sordidicola]